jgi:hypothetical protein
MSFAKNPTENAIKLELWTSFDFLNEVYDFYNMYFWGMALASGTAQICSSGPLSKKLQDAVKVIKVDCDASRSFEVKILINMVLCSM